MKRLFPLVSSLFLLLGGALWAAESVPPEAPAVAAPTPAAAGIAAPAQVNGAPLMKTVLDPKKNEVDAADCIIGCHTAYRACVRDCDGDYQCRQDCYWEMQNCKDGCSLDPPDECWPDPFPCGPCPIPQPGDPPCP